MLVLALGLVGMGTLYAAAAPSTPATVDVAQSTQIQEGKELFTIGCSSCHGLGGEGVIDEAGIVLGPTLIGVGAAAVDFQVSTGRMPAARTNSQLPRKKVAYTEEQIAAMAAFVASLAPGPEIPAASDYDPGQGNISRGGQLYRSNCASCHNTSGQGGALTLGKYAPKLTGVDPEHIYEAMLTGPQAMPVFSDEVLDPESKRDIIAYLSAIEETPNPGGLGIGRIGPVSEGLWAWLVGMGALIGVAVWIGAKSR
jgi:ubiquinol-cytochrome c reductase cytochrome c subunit